MCGIFCAYNLKVGDKEIRKVQALLRHRGPDASGVLRKKNLTMIHTRLSIIDLSKHGNQPMCHHAGDLWLILNGEIYNYLELKKQLRNYPFKSRSDSEVVLACYEKWGEGFVERLRGMFALCLYDMKKNKLILAVDRFSIKPLYYYHHAGQLIVSSEIKPIFLFLRGKEPNYVALARFLNYGMLNYDNETLFKDILQLQGSEMLVWSNGYLRKQKYWDLSKVKECSYSSEKFIELIRDKLSEAIKLHWRSDVKIGLNLSSGLDSNLLYEFSKIYFPQQRSRYAFTYCFTGTIYDEGKRIDPGRFKLNQVKTNILVNNFFRRLESFIYSLEEPSLGLGCLGYYENARSVQEKGIKVVLDGQGADEVFAGYKYYYFEYLKYLHNRKADNFKEELRFFLSSHGEKISEKIFIKDLARRQAVNAVQAPDGTALDGNNFVTDSFQKQYFAPFPKFLKPFRHPAKNLMYRDITCLKIPKLLRYQDKAAMAFSIEVRVPYLDHELVSLAFSADTNMHLRLGKTKAILRDIYNEFGVNDKSQENCKLYVSAPQREWIKEELRGEILRYIDNSVLAESGIINKEKLKKDYLAYCNQKELGNSFFVWKFINTEIWFRKFIIEDSCHTLA